tara:strand:- start:145 stop:393 length:249 start_codon:yes stop_codon:yes gene_type:complete
MTHKKLKRQTRFIVDSEGKVYLPRPSSWFSGYVRRRWVENILNKRTFLAGPRRWCELGRQYRVRRLFGYKDGTWEMIVYEDQ